MRTSPVRRQPILASFEFTPWKVLLLASCNEIPVSKLARLVGTPDCHVLLDVRLDENFDADPELIPGATRHAWQDAVDLAGDVASRSQVVYCQKGLKISEGVAAYLRASGVEAELPTRPRGALTFKRTARRPVGLPATHPLHGQGPRPHDRKTRFKHLEMTG